jgi:hypothetical protein
VTGVGLSPFARALLLAAALAEVRAERDPDHDGHTRVIEDITAREEGTA